LTYSSSPKLSIGSVVSVPLKTTVKNAVVVEEVGKPKFETAEMVSISDKFYSTEQIQIAKFISKYYFSSFGEAISLFLPYRRGAPCGYPLDKKTMVTQGQPQGIAPTLTPSQQITYETILNKQQL